MRAYEVAHHLYAHITWCTEKRIPLIADQTELSLKGLIEHTYKEAEYELIALETVPDHVHLLVRFHPVHRIADFVKLVKRRTSRLVGKNTGCPLKWQKGYGVDTVGTKSLDIAKRYILGQKQHHRERLNTVA